MHVIIVTPEVSPYSETTDLAELCAFLPAALCQQEVQVTLITPFYQGIDPSRHGLARRLLRIPVQVGGETIEVGLIDGKFQSADVSLLMVDHPESFDRAGLYGDADGPFQDNARRFYIFCAAVAGMIQELDLRPDLVHAAGWQTGFLPHALAAQDQVKDVPLVFSIQDEQDAGLVPAATLKELGVSAEGLERDGQVSLLELGAVGAAAVLARGPSHARDLARDETGALYGLFSGLEGRLTGILPGVEASMWDPSRNHRLPYNFEAGDLAGKADGKLALQAELGLTVDGDRPLLLMTDLTAEAGLDLVLAGAQAVPPEDMYQLVLAGALEDDGTLAALAAANPGAFHHMSELKDADLHRLLAGADALLLPVKRERSLLTVLKAMRYGVAPFTRPVGAMRDAVVLFDADTDTGTGALFSGEGEDDFAEALIRFVTVLANPTHRDALARNAMSHPFAWDHAAMLYKELYEGLTT